MNDIFTGSYVKAFVSTNTNGELDFYDTKFKQIKGLAGFPSIETTKQSQNFEDYRQDFAVKLSGDANVSDVQLNVLSTSDETVKIIDDALMNKQKLRFKVVYQEQYEEENTIEGILGSGLYHVFDAYVTKKATTGSNNSVVTNNYTLAVDGPVARGYAEAGKILTIGDFGVGAGTENVSGVKDVSELSGNRWVTIDSTHPDNVYAVGTSLMSVQHPENKGWQMIGSSVGTPSIRIRNMQKDPDGMKKSKWVKVYTELEKPTAKDTGALPINGGTLTGDLVAQNIKAKATTQDVALVNNPQDTRVNALTRKDYVDSELDKKLDNTDYQTDKTQTDKSIEDLRSEKADITYVDSEIVKVKESIIGSDEFDKKLDKSVFEDYATRTDAELVSIKSTANTDRNDNENKFNTKADITYVDSELAKKLDATDFDSYTTSNDSSIENIKSTKADITYVDSKADELQTQIDNINLGHLDNKLEVTVFEEYKKSNDKAVENLETTKADKSYVTDELNKVRTEFIPLNNAVIDFGEI